MEICIKSPLGGGKERMNHGFGKEYVGTCESCMVCSACTYLSMVVKMAMCNISTKIWKHVHSPLPIYQNFWKFWYQKHACK